MNRIEPKKDLAIELGSQSIASEILSGKRNINARQAKALATRFFTIQQALGAGGNQAFTFGRNEPGVQHFHRTVEAIMAAPPGQAWGS